MAAAASGRMRAALAWALLASVPLTQTPVRQPLVVSSSATAQEEALIAARRDFGTALSRYREGDEGALAELREQADTLCREHDRCDARAIADYYASLSAEVRALGVAHEARFNELWRAVRDLGALSGAEWESARVPILAELDALAGGARDADVSIAARALSLRARLAVFAMEQDPELSGEQRALLGESARGDALESIELFERTGYLTPRLEPRWTLGRLERFRGEPAAARTSFESVLRDARHTRQAIYSQHALLGLAALARDRGDVKSEERLLLQLAEFAPPSSHWDLARLWARRLLLSDHPDHAIDFLKRHAPVSDGDPDGAALDPERRQWELLMGSALVRTSDLAGARRHFEVVSSAAHDTLADLGMALLELHEGDPLSTLERLRGTFAQGSASPQVRALAHTLRGEAHLELDQPELAVEELESALNLADEHRGRLLRGRLLDAAESATLNVIGEWEGAGLHTVALLAEAHRRRGDPLQAALAIERFQSRGLRDRALESLRSLGGFEGERELDVEDLRAWGRHFELGWVTWVVGADFTVAASLAPSGAAHAVRIELGRAEVHEAVRRLREAVVAGERWRELARELRERLLPRELLELEPASAETPASGRRLMLLHGPLEALPIELLEPHSGVVSVVLPGLPAAEPGMPRDTRSGWQLLGDPLAGSPPRAVLPGASRELAALARLHPGAGHVGGAAFAHERVHAALRDALNVHIATHVVTGCASDERRFPSVGLLLSHGDVLCAEEIHAWKPALELAVLSACESGGGAFVDAQGLHGLARAFLDSGTRNVVATLWPVEDVAAQRFSELFHAALAEGALPSLAVSTARQGLRDSGAHAADWAAFRLLGRD